MTPSSNLATHWPISEQSALIPSSSKELFFLALFGSWSRDREYPASREERPLSHPFLLDTPALTIFAKDNCCYLQHSADTWNTAATWNTQKNFSYSDTSLLSVIKINLSLFFKEVLLFYSALHKQLQINL